MASFDPYSRPHLVGRAWLFIVVVVVVSVKVCGKLKCKNIKKSIVITIIHHWFL